MNKNENRAVESAMLPASFRDAVSVLKGRKPARDAKPEVSLPVLLPVSAQIAANDVAERKESLRIGEAVAGGDIFFGVWTPVDRRGNRLGKTFNLFAQPRDISVEKFLDLQKRVAGLPNGFNHKAARKAPDAELFEALQSGAYKGEYFIPPMDVLHMLYRKRNVGEFRNTFADEKFPGFSLWYWSCTRSQDDLSYMQYKRFSDGYESSERKNFLSLSARLVRAEVCG